MSSVVLSDEEIKLVYEALDAFIDVINSYITFLVMISQSLNLYLSMELKDEEAIDRRKFSAVRKELFNFLDVHKNIYDVKELRTKHDDGSVLYKKPINIVEDGENFLNKDDIFILVIFANDELSRPLVEV
mgnify:CR=1 FL=1